MKVKITSIALVLTFCFLFISCKKDNIQNNVQSKSRLIEVLYTDSQWKMKLKYNSDGRLVSTFPNGGDTLFYDNQDRLVKYFDGYVTYSFEYGTNGKIMRRIPVSTISPSYHPDTIDYHYDANDRIVKCTSTFSDQMNIPRQGWIRYYTYNTENDITNYGAAHPYYNQTEYETLSYDKGENPLKLSNSILFFLNEHNYVALNQHNPKRKDNQDMTHIYSYDYSTGTLPGSQSIKSYSPGQPIDLFNYNWKRQIKFSYE